MHSTVSADLMPASARARSSDLQSGVECAPATDLSCQVRLSAEDAGMCTQSVCMAGAPEPDTGRGSLLPPQKRKNQSDRSTGAQLRRRDASGAEGRKQLASSRNSPSMAWLMTAALRPLHVSHTGRRGSLPPPGHLALTFCIPNNGILLHIVESYGS